MNYVESSKDAVNLATILLNTSKNIIISVYGKDNAKSMLKEYVDKI